MDAPDPQAKAKIIAPGGECHPGGIPLSYMAPSTEKLELSVNRPFICFEKYILNSVLYFLHYSIINGITYLSAPIYIPIIWAEYFSQPSPWIFL